jgi:hypothetical protein
MRDPHVIHCGCHVSRSPGQQVNGTHLSASQRAHSSVHVGRRPGTRRSWLRRAKTRWPNAGAARDSSTGHQIGRRLRLRVAGVRAHPLGHADGAGVDCGRRNRAHGGCRSSGFERISHRGRVHQVIGVRRLRGEALSTHMCSAGPGTAGCHGGELHRDGTLWPEQNEGGGGATATD